MMTSLHWNGRESRPRERRQNSWLQTWVQTRGILAAPSRRTTRHIEVAHLSVEECPSDMRVPRVGNSDNRVSSLLVLEVYSLWKELGGHARAAGIGPEGL